MFFDAHLHKQLMFEYFPFNFIYVFLYLQRGLVGERKLPNIFYLRSKGTSNYEKNDLDVPSIPLESPISWETQGNLLIVTLNKI